MSQNYQAFLDERCEKLGTNHNVNCFNILLISQANCCWKSKWLSLLQKRSPTLVISTQNWSILAKFAKKMPAKSAVFYWLFLGEVSTRNFPWYRPIFLRICPWKSFKNWLFSAKIPRNGLIFLRILTSLPRKLPEIGRFFCKFAPENPAKFCFFFCKISEALTLTQPLKIGGYMDTGIHGYSVHIRLSTYPLSKYLLNNSHCVFAYPLWYTLKTA